MPGGEMNTGDRAVVALQKPRIGWVNASQEQLAFVPPMSEQELAEAKAVMPEGTQIVRAYQGVAETARGVETATVLAVRSKARLAGSYPSQVERGPAENAAALGAAISGLTTWWTSKDSSVEK